MALAHLWFWRVFSRYFDHVDGIENGGNVGYVRSWFNLCYFCFVLMINKYFPLLRYPLQVVRTRMQLAPKSTIVLQNERPPPHAPHQAASTLLRGGVLATVRHALATEGPVAFYKGAWAATLRTLPGTAITFIVYERVSQLFE
jgi:hypothetical protein